MTKSKGVSSTALFGSYASLKSSVASLVSLFYHIISNITINISCYCFKLLSRTEML
jgi:hypothetical protein